MKKILVVDDDREFAMSLKRVLEENSYSVIAAFNSTEAINLAVSEKPDIIILDVMMEQTTSGFHIAYDLRNKFNLKTPIIMLTMIGEVKKMKFGVSDGEFLPVDEFIEKPVDFLRLLEVLKKYAGS